jgi:hypothetical protein
MADGTLYVAVDAWCTASDPGFNLGLRWPELNDLASRRLRADERNERRVAIWLIHRFGLQFARQQKRRPQWPPFSTSSGAVVTSRG